MRTLLLLHLLFLIGCVPGNERLPEPSEPATSNPIEGTSTTGSSSAGGSSGGTTTGGTTGGTVGGTTGGTNGGTTTGGTSTGGTTPGTPITGPINETGTVSPTVVSEFLALVNNHRAALKLPLLVSNSVLQSIATDHSTNMANKTVPYGHDGFEARCYDAASQIGSGSACAENIIGGVTTAHNMFYYWMTSPGHRANLENPNVRRAGLGGALSSDTFYYWTLLLL